MQINVEYIDRNKRLSVLKPILSLPAFLKHAAISGQGGDYGFLPSMSRGIGVMMFYGRYFDMNWLLKFHGFKKPLMHFYDPTEQAAFSNIVGKAIADFLSKEILGAKFTHSYEAVMYAMGYGVSHYSQRPDLYCTTSNQQFLVEAKGYSKRSVGPREMQTHKLQSQSGPIKVNFSVASVAYNIYSGIRCKFHDPVSPDVPFHKAVNDSLAKQYYLSLHEQLIDYIEPEFVEINDRGYEAFNLSPYFFLGRKGLGVKMLFDKEIMRNIEGENILDIEYPRVNEHSTYIDADGVGIVIG